MSIGVRPVQMAQASLHATRCCVASARDPRGACAGTPSRTQDGCDAHGMDVPTPTVRDCRTTAQRRLGWRPRPSESGVAAPALLFVLHVTPIGGVFPRKKRLQLRLNLLLKHRTLLVRLHGVERVP